MLAAPAVAPADPEPFLCAFGDGWALYHPATDKLLLLNQTGRMVWEMWREGRDQDAIASAFASHFSIAVERAWRDVGLVLGELGAAGSLDDEAGGEDSGLLTVAVSVAGDSAQLGDCGRFRFGETRVRVVSSVADLDRLFFARFQHRSVAADGHAELLEVSQADSRFLLTFRGELVAETKTTSKMISFVNELLLTLEHPDHRLLAYCHAGAVCWGGHSLLMPGRSGAGKSTLTAFLVANGFAYLGDDTIALGEDGAALLPLPTALSIKSGSWPILGSFYPILPHTPTIHRYARRLRYVEPDCETLQTAAAPAAIVFPIYAADAPTRLTPVAPLQTMIRLLGAHARLSTPATEAKLDQLIRFVEQTPAYELSYSQLPDAMQAIKDLLGKQR